jgi:phage shock protein PspC (stress-responsive transcriptional regulator)/heme/copper-type cytochrome/quinol oxidase subunit 2
MGRPEDFDDEEANIKSQLGGEQKQQNNSSSQQSSYTYIPGEPKRLYRDENHKVLGGVCSGIANYFGIDPVVVRILSIIFFGVTFLVYPVLWIAVPSSATQVIGSQRKRLFRDPDDKVIAGVCSGLAQYFGLSVWIPRVLFLIPFFSFIFHWSHWGFWDFPFSLSFSPTSLFIYIVLWLVIPEAKSTADKLEMKGEKVDLNNIKTTIQNDMEGFKERAREFGNEVKEKAQDWGKEFGQTVGEKGKQFSAEATYVAKKSSRGLGDIIVLIVKIFAYFILGVVLLGVVVSLFTIGVVFTGLLPAKEFVISDGWENIFAWGTLLLFVWVPVIGLVTLIIRRLTKIKGNSGLIRYTFLSLWLVGLFCFIGLLASLSNDFRYGNHPVEENVALSNARVNKLELTVPSYARYYNTRRWLRLEPFASFDDDTVFVQNIRIRIVRSNSDSFRVSMVKLANGNSKRQADDFVSQIKYTVLQQDTLLTLDRGIALTPNEKFRNQKIVLTVAVPVGKKIKINDRVGQNENVHVGIGWNNDDWGESYYNDQDEERWDHNTEYIMTAKGLEAVDKKEDKTENNDDSTDDVIKDFKKSKDQILKEKEQKLKELRDIDKELQNRNDSIQRYHYQPDNPRKTEGKKTLQSAVQLPKTESLIRMSDLIMLRFPI